MLTIQVLIQVLAVLLCTLLLWTILPRDRKKITLGESIFDGFFLFGIVTAGIGSVAMWWEMITLHFLTGYSVAFFAGGLGTIILTLAIESRQLIRSFLLTLR